MKAVLAIALTEIRIGIRNRWVLLSAAILAIFSILLVVLGSGPSGTVDAHPLTVAVASLSTLAVYLIPLIALLLSFDAVAGEVDRGTLQLVLATPIARWQVLFGKFIGHTAVLTMALQADPTQDATVDELVSLLTRLGRYHELLALLSARLEDAPADRREALLPKQRTILTELADRAEREGRADEAALFRMVCETLS